MIPCLENTAGADAELVGQADAGEHSERQTRRSGAVTTPVGRLEDALSKEEQTDLTRLVKRLEKLRGVWFETLEVLAEIKVRRLYRDKHPDFHTFCHKVLGMGKSNANRCLQSAEVARRLATNVVRPELEAHVRPLLKLDDPEDQVRCFQSALEAARNANRPLKGSDVQRAVRAALTPVSEGETPLTTEPSKADIITRLQRALARGLEQREPPALLAFEEAVARFSQTWWQNQPASSEDETKGAGAGGAGAEDGRAYDHE